MTDSGQTAALTALVLAAGGSGRYGRCKQLVEINGASLVRAAVGKLASLLPCDRINVVVGANAEAVIRNLDGLPANIVHNRRWRQGLASSLRAGVNSVAADSRAILITLCDQALVTEERLRQLIQLWVEQPSKIIAGEYADTLGTPAIIPSGFYPQIRALEGDTGAKSILESHAGQVVKLPLPEAEFDLDVPADLEKLKRSPYRNPASG